MSKKPLPDLRKERLDSLFADLEPEPLPDLPEAQQVMAGWTWETDFEGRYQSCSPEVQAVLGYPPEAFIGKFLAEHLLTPASAAALQSVLQTGVFPQAVEVEFIAASGLAMRTTLHILPSRPGAKGNGKARGLHGFVQAGARTPVTPAETTPPDLSPPQIPSAPHPDSDATIKPSDTPVTSTREEQSEFPPAPVTSPPPPTAGEPATGEPSIASDIPTTPIPPHPHPGHPDQLITPRLAPRQTEPPTRPISRPAPVEPPSQPRPAPVLPTRQETMAFRDDEVGLRSIPLGEALSPAGQESLTSGKPVVTNASPASPAVLAQPALVDGGSASLLLEILDEDPSRQWTAEERLLVEQVTDQLTLALDNARLFQQNLVLLQEVEQDRQRYSDLYNRAPDCYFSIDASGTFIEFNQTGLTWIGYTREEVVGKMRIIDILAPYSRPVFASSFPRLQKDGRVDNLEVDFMRKNGTTFAVLVDATALYDAKGKVSQSRTIARDVTRLRQLEQRQRQLARAIEATADMVVITDRTGNILFANAASEQITGYRRDEIIGKNPRILKSGHQDKLFYEKMWSTILVGQVWRGEIINRRKNGSFYYAQLTISPIANEHNEVNQFVAVQRDITPQKRAEAEREKLLAETEILYTASAELNAARSYNDILTTLRRYSLAGAGAHQINISVFDRPWKPGILPNWIDVAAEWAQTPADSFEQHYPFQSYPTLARHLRPNAHFIVEDIASDTRIDDNFRTNYLKILKATSTIFVPLVVSGEWLGFINANYPKRINATEPQIRRLMVLAGQASVAFQNIRLLKESHLRNEELSALNTIIATASRSLDLETMLNDILEQVLDIIDFQSGIISVVDAHTNKLRIAASRNLPVEFTNLLSATGLETTLCGIVHRRDEVVHIPDFGEVTPVDVSPLLALGLRSFLGIPLELKGRVLGTVCVFSEQVQTRPPDILAVIQAIGQQVGVAIENALLFEQTNAALNTTETLYQASAELNAAATFDAVLDVLRSNTILGAGTRNVTLALFDHPWLPESPPEWLLTAASWAFTPEDELPEPRYPLNNLPFAGQLFKPDAVVTIENPSKDPRLDAQARELFVEMLKARSLLFAPLVVGGQWIGQIIAIYQSPTRFEETNLRQLSSLVGQAAVAVQNNRLLQETRRRADQLQTAAVIARDSSGTLALDTLLGRAVNLICEGFNYYHASLFLLDGLGNAVVRASTGEAGEEMKRKGHNLAVGSRSVIGYVTKTGSPLVINDVLQDFTHRPNPLLPHTRAELGIPLKLGERVIGALDVQSTEVSAFNPDDISVLQILADQIAVAVDNARAYGLSQDAVSEMRKADQLKSQFLANMSHELRTPLNSIIGFSRVIIKGIDGPVTELQQQDLTAIYNSGQHLLNLINDILDLSKIEAGKMEMSLEDNVNITDIINSVMSTVAGLIKDRPIQIHKEIAADLPVVRADPLKVRQILINLLSNAAKFTEEGVITLRANASADARGMPELRIEVQDTGPGINIKDQAKLFLPFSQVDGSPTRKTGGSGLGLSICRHLVDMHGGQIGLTSVEGQGSTFYFTLPMQPIRKATGSLALPPEAPLVLAIDDERQILNLYERYLHNHGYRVLGISDPTRAVEAARLNKPVAITLDVIMPGKDGWQVLSALKSDPATRDIPVILCTISTEQEKGLRLGASEYLMKPILEEDLVQALNHLNKDNVSREVMLIDIDPADRRLIQNVIHEHPHIRLVNVENGKKALTHVQARRPHTILLDMNMPDLEPFTLLETLRADPLLVDTPVVVIAPKNLDEGQHTRMLLYTPYILIKGQFTEAELYQSLDKSLKRHPAAA